VTVPASNRVIAVFGAYGHTARFVVAELGERGWTPVLSGRDAAKLARGHSAVEPVTRCGLRRSCKEITCRF
jgi:short subunit dehydrogenase-like uncharacterized protein